MLKVYGFTLSPPANKVRFVANYLGLDYQYIDLKPFEGEHKKPEHLARHPAGKVPVIEDGDFILFESDAIIRYLANKAKNNDLYPSDLKARAIVDQWMDYTNSQIGTSLMKIFYNEIIAKKRGYRVNELAVLEGKKGLTIGLGIIEAQLADKPYLCGHHITLTDMCLLACLDPAELIGVNLDNYPRISAWRKNLMAQDFYQRVHQNYSQLFE